MGRRWHPPRAKGRQDKIEVVLMMGVEGGGRRAGHGWRVILQKASSLYNRWDYTQANFINALKDDFGRLLPLSIEQTFRTKQVVFTHCPFIRENGVRLNKDIVSRTNIISFVSQEVIATTYKKILESFWLMCSQLHFVFFPFVKEVISFHINLNFNFINKTIAYTENEKSVLNQSQCKFKHPWKM